MVLPSYLLFRLIVTYYALETLLTLAFAPAAEPGPAEGRPKLTLVQEPVPSPGEEEALPIAINSEA
jgi:hypothetical protein